jgi:hypothetical protein
MGTVWKLLEALGPWVSSANCAKQHQVAVVEQQRPFADVLWVMALRAVRPRPRAALLLAALPPS